MCLLVFREEYRKLIQSVIKSYDDWYSLRNKMWKTAFLLHPEQKFPQFIWCFHHVVRIWAQLTHVAHGVPTNIQFFKLIQSHAIKTYQILQIISGQFIDNNCTKTVTHNIDRCTESVPVEKCIDYEKKKSRRTKLRRTYKSQSTAKMMETSSAGKPTVSNTMIIVTRPAWGWN